MGVSITKGVSQGDIPKIKGLLKEVLGSEEYKELTRMGGLTNHTYKVVADDGSEYVVRIPGEGTEEIIVRDDERACTVLACDLGIDAKMLYFGKDGSKVTEYIPGAVTMSAESMKDPEILKGVAAIFRKLHDCGVDTGVPFEVFDMARSYEKVIGDMNVPMYEDFASIKERVISIKDEMDSSLDIKKVPCHNDALCENWVLGGDRLYLIDWEYAGMNDGMWDIADVSIEAGLNAEQDSVLLCAYLGEKPRVIDEKHFLASKIYVDFLWTLWAKARVPYDGQPMEDWASERYARLKGFLEQYSNL